VVADAEDVHLPRPPVDVPVALDQALRAIANLADAIEEARRISAAAWERGRPNRETSSALEHAAHRIAAAQPPFDESVDRLRVLGEETAGLVQVSLDEARRRIERSHWQSRDRLKRFARNAVIVAIVVVVATAMYVGMQLR
jgi:hypothetical protein